jgi:hypothetical protein
MLTSLSESDAEAQAWVTAFKEGLQKFGWAQDRNIRIDYRWGAGTRTLGSPVSIGGWERLRG